MSQEFVEAIIHCLTSLRVKRPALVWDILHLSSATNNKSLAMCHVDGLMMKSQMHSNGSVLWWFLFSLGLVVMGHRINHVLCLRDLHAKPQGGGSVVPAISIRTPRNRPLLTLSSWSETDFAKYQIRKENILSFVALPLTISKFPPHWWSSWYSFEWKTSAVRSISGSAFCDMGVRNSPPSHSEGDGGSGSTQDLPEITRQGAGVGSLLSSCFCCPQLLKLQPCFEMSRSCCFELIFSLLCSWWNFGWL